MKVNVSSVILTVVLSLTLLPVPSTASAKSGKDVLPQLSAKAIVRAKKPVPVSDHVRQYLSQQGGEAVLIWAFFTDKGVFTKNDFDAQASTVKFSEKVLKRRAKTGMDHVVFVDLPVVPEYVERIVNLGATHRRTSRWLNAASFEVSMEQLDEIGSLPFVSEIKPVVGYKSESTPVDQLRIDVPPRKALDPDPDTLNYGSALAQLNQINVPPVHQKGYHGEGVTLAMFDTGFRKTHEAFAQHYLDGRVLAEYDFVFDDSNTANEPEDWSSAWNHGTLTWSTTSGEKDGVLYGPAYRASFILCKTEDVRSETPIEEDNWVAALEWVDGLGADVVSSSLAYADWYTYEDFDGMTATTTLAANTAASLGIVVCNAMANSGPAPGTLHAPADAFDILAVGAVNSSGTIASFSSRGPTFDGRTKPEVCARGVSTACATASSDASYGSASGTSLSTPLIAGATVLLVQARPTFSPQLIRQALMETADNADSPNNDYGWGIINLDAALSWGANFYADVTEGDAPLSVQFFDSSSLTVSSWTWSFGDGDSAFVQNPTHLYADAGAYDVSLTVGTEYGDITSERLNYIVALADTVRFRSDSAFAGQQVVMSVDAVNSQGLKSIIIPFQFESDSLIEMDFDSATFGSRTGYFEQLQYLAWNPANNKYTVELIADNGGGAPPLTAGSGEIMKMYFTIDSLAFGGLVNVVDSTHGAMNLEIFTDGFNYQPAFYSGTIGTKAVIRGDADYTQSINIADVTYLVTYFFHSGSPPVTVQSGDADFDSAITIGDLTYLVDYLFRGGPPPPTP